VSPQELFAAWQKCYDVHAFAEICPQLAGLCTDAGGTTVRRICPWTCGTCLATTDGRLHAQEAELVRALEALGGAAGAEGGAEGAEPSVTVLRLGAEQTPLLVIDGFLPAAAVRAAAMAASESQLWQPPRPDVARHWASPDGQGSPRDARGLFAPPGVMADTFPGLISPLHAAYERQMWARLRGLKLDQHFDAVLEKPLQGEGVGVVVRVRVRTRVRVRVTRTRTCTRTRTRTRTCTCTRTRTRTCTRTCVRTCTAQVHVHVYMCRGVAHGALLRPRLLLARAPSPGAARAAHGHERRAAAGDDPLPHGVGLHRRRHGAGRR
jgi:hypothetical protein